MSSDLRRELLASLGFKNDGSSEKKLRDSLKEVEMHAESLKKIISETNGASIIGTTSILGANTIASGLNKLKAYKAHLPDQSKVIKKLNDELNLLHLKAARLLGNDHETHAAAKHSKNVKHQPLNRHHHTHSVHRQQHSKHHSHHVSAHRHATVFHPMTEFRGGTISGLTPQETLAFANRVMSREDKSGRLEAVNKWGYTGKYQFGASALAETGFIDPEKLKSASRGVKSGSNGAAQKAFLADKNNWIKGDWEQYKSNAEMQDESFRKLVEQNLKYGKKVHKGDKRKMLGFAMAAHLKGAGAAAKWYRYGKDSSDANGTKASDYAKFGEGTLDDINTTPLPQQTPNSFLKKLTYFLKPKVVPNNHLESKIKTSTASSIPSIENNNVGSPSAYRLLGDAISSGEGGYNSVNRGLVKIKGTKKKKNLGHYEEDLSKITINEAIKRNSLPITDKRRMNALGKYQVITTTSEDLIANHKITGNEKLTPEFQDTVLLPALLPKAAKDYISHKSNDRLAAEKAIATIWASVGVPVRMYNKDHNRWIEPGHSFYETDGTNKANTKSLEKVRKALDELRNQTPATAVKPTNKSKNLKSLSLKEFATTHLGNILTNAPPSGMPDRGLQNQTLQNQGTQPANVTINQTNHTTVHEAKDSQATLGILNQVNDRQNSQMARNLPTALS